MKANWEPYQIEPNRFRCVCSSVSLGWTRLCGPFPPSVQQTRVPELRASLGRGSTGCSFWQSATSDSWSGLAPLRSRRPALHSSGARLHAPNDGAANGAPAAAANPLLLLPYALPSIFAFSLPFARARAFPAITSFPAATATKSLLVLDLGRQSGPLVSPVFPFIQLTPPPCAVQAYSLRSPLKSLPVFVASQPACSAAIVDAGGRCRLHDGGREQSSSAGPPRGGACGRMRLYLRAIGDHLPTRGHTHIQTDTQTDISLRCTPDDTSTHARRVPLPAHLRPHMFLCVEQVDAVLSE